MAQKYEADLPESVHIRMATYVENKVPIFNPPEVPRGRWAKVSKALWNNAVPLSTLISVMVAIGMGLILRSTTGRWSDRPLTYLEFPGELFIRMLKSVIVPLITSSLITALGNMDLRLSAWIGLRTVLFYCLTTLFAIVLGIILVTTIQPGKHFVGEDLNDDFAVRKTTTADTILDLFR